jgi:AcrR family transcriptional regulator
VPKIVDHDERRRAYADALWRVVSQHGASAISVRAVAAEAGVSPSNLVHYMPTRADMLSIAVNQLLSTATPRVPAPDASLESWAVDAVMSAIPHTPARRRQSEVWLMLVAERSSNPDAERLLTEVQQRVAAGLAEGLQVLADAGLVGAGRHLGTETARLHALVDGLSLRSVIAPKSLPTAELRTIVAAHLADLRTPAT